jgi:hypothetical protein
MTLGCNRIIAVDPPMIAEEAPGEDTDAVELFSNRFFNHH